MINKKLAYRLRKGEKILNYEGDVVKIIGITVHLDGWVTLKYENLDNAGSIGLMKLEANEVVEFHK